MAENYLNQAKGSNVSKSIAFEANYNGAPTGSAYKLKFNPGDGVKASRDLNTAETIQSGRSPVEPFQGNGTVDGTEVLPLDLNQMYLLLKAAFGTPATTAPSASDLKTVSAVANNSSSVAGTVKFTVASGHGIAQGDFFAITGTTNYNKEYKAVSATATEVVAKADYVAETFTNAKATKIGWTHVFTIPTQQPSFTLEQMHNDIAERFCYKGCKISTIGIGAASDGQENTVSFGIMGSKPINSAPVRISSFAEGTSGNVVAAFSGSLAVEVGSYVVIAGSRNYDGRYAVVAKTDTSVTFAHEYTAEAITSGKEPVMNVSAFGALKNIEIKRLNTFSAKFFKDGEEYKCAKDVTIDIDMGLDGEQRVIGDNGYRSELPEGTIGITTALTALFKSGVLFREGARNATVSVKLQFEASEGIGLLEIELPNNKVQESAPAVDTAAGLSQSVTLQAFGSENESAIKVTLTNAYAAM